MDIISHLVFFYVFFFLFLLFYLFFYYSWIFFFTFSSLELFFSSSSLLTTLLIFSLLLLAEDKFESSSISESESIITRDFFALGSFKNSLKKIQFKKLHILSSICISSLSGLSWQLSPEKI